MIQPGTEVHRTDIHGNVLPDSRRYWVTSEAGHRGGDLVLRFEPANALGQTEIAWAGAQVVPA
jgi:hypothetical protein